MRQSRFTERSAEQAEKAVRIKICVVFTGIFHAVQSDAGISEQNFAEEVAAREKVNIGLQKMDEHRVKVISLNAVCVKIHFCVPS